MKDFDASKAANRCHNYEVAYMPHPKADAEVWRVSIKAAYKDAADAEMSKRYPREAGGRSSYSFTYLGATFSPRSKVKMVFEV